MRMWLKLLLLASFVCVPGAGAGAQTVKPGDSTLIVIGEAEQSSVPDTALLTVGVTKEAETASAALQSSSQFVRQLVSLANRMGIEGRDIQTFGLALQPRYSRPRSGSQDDKAIITGYMASNQLSIRVRKIDTLGDVLDQFVRAGANEIRNLAFDVSDRRRLLDEARARAVEDAKRRANILANAAGLRLGEIISLEEEGGGGQFSRTAASPRALEAASSVPIEAGEIGIRARVRVVWRIAP
jgi:uncharacterized protein YggE